MFTPKYERMPETGMNTLAYRIHRTFITSNRGSVMSSIA